MARCTACFCINYRSSVRMIAFMSCFLGIAVAGLSAWMLHKTLQLQKTTSVTTSHIRKQTNVVYVGLVELDLEILYKILTSTATCAMIGGGFQFLTSFVLLFASVRDGICSNIMKIVWVISQIAIILAIGGSAICILINEILIYDWVLAFLGVTAIDGLAVIYFCFVAALSIKDSNERIRDSSLENEKINYSKVINAELEKQLQNQKDVETESQTSKLHHESANTLSYDDRSTLSYQHGGSGKYFGGARSASHTSNNGTYLSGTASRV